MAAAVNETGIENILETFFVKILENLDGFKNQVDARLDDFEKRNQQKQI